MTAAAPAAFSRTLKVPYRWCAISALGEEALPSVMAKVVAAALGTTTKR